MKQKAIITLGMHRSGTSAVAKCIYSDQLDFGKCLLKESYDNPNGFYENEKIVSFNDELIEYYQKSWDSWYHVTSDLGQLNSYYDKAISIVLSEFSLKKTLFIKDPRITILLPFWIEVFDRLSIECKYIVVVRHPRDIAGSLNSRNYFKKEKSYLLCSSYWISMVQHLRGEDFLVIDFNQLMNTPGLIKEYFDDYFKKWGVNLKLESLNSDFVHQNDIQELVGDFYFLNELYKDICQLTTENILSFDVKNDFLEKHNRVLSKQNINQIDEDEFVKIIFDFGEGFTEKDTILVKRVGNRFKKVIPVNVQQAVQAVKILMGNKVKSIELIELNVRGSSRAVKFSLSHNSILQKNNLIVYNDDYPQLILKLADRAKIDEIFLNFSLNSSNHHSTSLKKQKRKNLLLDLIITAFQNPKRILSILNRENFNTLRLALKREHPKEIVKNLKKLITQEKDQKIIESFRSKNLIELGSKSYKKGRTRSTVSEKLLLSILYIAPEIPDSTKSSGEKRATALLQLLGEKNEVVFLSIKKINSDKSIVNNGVKDYFDLTQLTEVKRKYHRIDFIVYSFYYTYDLAKQVRKLYPQTRSIIDTVDVHWVREGNSIEVWDGINETQFLANKAQEKSVYEKADKIWVVSDEDKISLLQEVPKKQIDIIPNIHQLCENSSPTRSNRNIVFIGGYNHYPNISAVKVLALQIFPKIREVIKDARLLIVGSNAPLEVAKLSEHVGVEFLGYVEDLQPIYANAKMTIVPLLAGAGMKGKITEAIKYRIPVITNSIGNQGIHLVHEESGLITEDVDEMAQYAIKIIEGKYDINDMTNNAYDLLKEIVDPKIVAKHLEKSLFRRVHINIVTFNQLSLLKKCVESLLHNTAYPIYDIQIYSNGCDDGTSEYLRELAWDHDNIKIIMNDNNEVFVRPNNLLFQIGQRNADVVLLNNDVEVVEDWLSHLSRDAFLMKNIGIVGSKLLYPNGALQEFGSVIYSDGSGKNFGKGDLHPDEYEYTKIKAVPYVSGCAMYIKREVIDAQNGFDDIFHPCYYEDSDLCYSAWLNGFSVVVSPLSEVIHHEGATSGTNENVGMKQYQHVNRGKFVEKHKSNFTKVAKLVSKTNKELKFFNKD